jgi:hypothetical protein
MEECNCRKCHYWNLRNDLDKISDKKFRFFPWWNESPANQNDWLEASIRRVNSIIQHELAN